jgi:hypothetical protein
MTNEEFEQLFKELQEKILGGDTNETQKTYQTYQTQDAQREGNQTPQPYEDTQEDAYSSEETSQLDVNEQQLQWWMNVGRTAFLSRYSNIPNLNISKYLQTIEQMAISKLQNDIQTGRVKDTYDAYLEEALRDILREITRIGNDFVNVGRVIKSYEAMAQQPAKPYTMEDYRRDYKKMLEYMTYKKIGDIHYKDSSEKGFYGEGKLKLGDELGEINI